MKLIKQTWLIRQKIRLNKITEIENYFHQEINQRKLCSKKLSKYVISFDFIDKVLIVLSVTSGGVSIISFASVAGAPVGIASAIFSLTAGIIKKLLSITRNKKKNHDKILMLGKSKLSNIETLVFQALTDIEIIMKNLSRFLRRKINMKKWKKMWGI